MEDTIVRAYEDRDAAAVARLGNVVVAHAGGHPGQSAEVVAAYMASAVRDSAADTRLVFEGGDELVAMAVVMTPPAAGPGPVNLNLGGGVHPTRRGQGWGRELLRWQLERATEIHRSAAPGRPWEAHLDVPLADEDAVRLFRRFGLAPARYWLDMVAPTTGAAVVGPAVAADAEVGQAGAGGWLPEGLRVEIYRAEHEAALHAAHMEVFAGHWGFQYRELARWAPVTVRGPDFLPGLSLLAFDGDGEIVGYVLSYEDPDPDRIYIGQVGVRRSWRRRGVAGVLLSRVLGLAAAAGRRLAWLAVDADSPAGAVGVYARAGFTVESRAVTYRSVIGGD